MEDQLLVKEELNEEEHEEHEIDDLEETFGDDS